MNGVTLTIIAETVLLVGVLTLLVRLHARVDALATRGKNLEAVNADRVAQMAQLVTEAQDLADSLADQLAAHVRVAEDVERKLATPRPSADAARERSTSATQPAANGQADQMDDRKTANAEPVKETAEDPREPLTLDGRAEEPRSRVQVTADDLRVAREAGMDPMGIALRRSFGAGR